MTESGLIKRIPTASFKTQKRNGKGVKSTDDIISTIIRTNTIDSLMIFSNKGVMYRLLVNDIPVGTNTSQGTPIKALISMTDDEIPSTIYSIYRDTEAKYVLFTTKQGMIKKTALEEYVNTKKKSGIGAINLREDDSLAAVSLIKDEELILVTARGAAIRFNSSEITATGRATAGVKGINLVDDDYVVASLPIRDKNDQLGLFVQTGMGKRVPLSELIIQKRGGKGLCCYKTSDITGLVAAAVLVNDDDTILIAGTPNSICISASELASGGRGTLGTQLLKKSKVSSASKV